VPRSGLYVYHYPHPSPLPVGEGATCNCCTIPSPFGRGTQGEGIRVTMPGNLKVLRQFRHAVPLQGAIYVTGCTSSRSAAGRLFLILVDFEGSLGLLIVVDHGTYGLYHSNRAIGLKDVAPHIHADRALGHRIVSHG